MSNVTALNGGVVWEAGDPQQSVIDELERLLEAAKSGKIQGLVAVPLYSDSMASYSITGPVLGSYNLIGALLIATNHLASRH